MGKDEFPPGFALFQSPFQSLVLGVAVGNVPRVRLPFPSGECESIPNTLSTGIGDDQQGFKPGLPRPAWRCISPAR